MTDTDNGARIYAVDPDNTDEPSGDLVEVVGTTTEDIPEDTGPDYEIVDIVPEEDIDTVELAEDELAFTYETGA